MYHSIRKFLCNGGVACSLLKLGSLEKIVIASLYHSGLHSGHALYVLQNSLPFKDSVQLPVILIFIHSWFLISNTYFFSFPGVFMNKGKQQKMINRKGGAQSVSELQQRLKAKLESLQGPKSDKPGKSDRKKLSKQEKKAKMMEEKKLASKMAKIRQNAAASSATAPATTNGVSKAKPVFNAEGKVVYSKFDLGTKSTINGQGTAANTSNPKKDPKAALASIQKQKEKLKKMEDKGETEIAKNMKESSAWTKALDKTEGVKVKDDVGLLKKSIKKQEQKKKSSAKKWTERRGDEKKKKDERQQKRTDNIKKRKTDVKANKMKKLAKRGRVPGFK